MHQDYYKSYPVLIIKEPVRVDWAEFTKPTNFSNAQNVRFHVVQPTYIFTILNSRIILRQIL